MARVPIPKESWDLRNITQWLITQIARRRIVDSFDWTPGVSAAASTTTDYTLTSSTHPALTGLRPGMVVAVSFPGLTGGLMLSAYISSVDSITLRVGNLTAAPVAIGSGTVGFAAELV